MTNRHIARNTRNVSGSWLFDSPEAAFQRVLNSVSLFIVVAVVLYFLQSSCDCFTCRGNPFGHFLATHFPQRGLQI